MAELTTVQIDRQTNERLNELARLTNRSKFHMLRHLIERAEVVGSDVVLRDQPRPEPVCEASK